MLIKTTAVVLSAAAVGIGGVAAADSVVTTLAVSDAGTLRTGDVAPVSVAGVRAIRRGRTIPAGYQLLGQTVQTTPGGPRAGAALTLRCPNSTRLRGLAAVGGVGFSVPDRNYAGKRQTLVITYTASPSSGTTQGTVYAACR
jgi:hypothetical protein